MRGRTGETMDEDSTQAEAWPELVDRKQAARERRIARTERRAATRGRSRRGLSPWLRMLLAWAAIAVVVAIAAIGIQAWNDRELVVVPESVAGLPLAPEGSSLALEAQRINALQAPQARYDLSKTRQLVYGDYDRYVWATVYPTGRLVSLSTLGYVTADVPGVRWEEPERIGDVWCARESADALVVMCVATDDDASVVLAALHADMALAARATEELLAVQTG